MDLYIGLISGTSMDGVDAVVVDLAENQSRLLASHSEPLTSDLRAALAQLAEAQLVALEELLRLDVLLGRTFAAAANTVIGRAGVPRESIRGIGSHGQTVRHLPEGHTPSTLQIGDPNVIAELTGIETVADFRRRDMAAGGQGAPLAPAFHAHHLSATDETRVVLNIGGISNVTMLPCSSPDVFGFDTGPGNGLMDRWSERHLGHPFDEGGRFAKSGSVHTPLLQAFLADPYFARQPPKSTGREYFNLAWTERVLRDFPSIASRDVQRTLCELTALTISQAITTHRDDTATVIVAGGGVHNTFLLQRIGALNPKRTVCTSESYGIDPDWLEAIAFAWLAKRRLDNAAGNLNAVTGAQGPRILGAVFAPHSSRD